jgi:ribose transport system substrate-binding protein
MTATGRGPLKTIVRDQMSRRDFIKAVAAATGAALILPACRPAATPTPGASELTAGLVDTTPFKKDPPWTVGRSGMGEVNSWQVIRSHHFDYGFNRKYAGMFGEVIYTQAFFDPAQQVADLEDILTHDIDVLFVHPVSGGNAIAQIEEAMSRNIPVILGGARAYTENYVSYVDRDNPGCGLLYAEYVARKINYEGNVVLMMGLAGNTYAEDVLRGAREGLAKYPGIVEAGLEWGEWSPVVGKSAMEALLVSVDRIDAILNDGGDMGIGIIDAYLDAGLPIPPMCGDDNNGWLRKAKENNVQFLAVHGGAELALDEVDISVKVLNGEPVPKNILADIPRFEEDALDTYYRPDLNDQYWAINELPEDLIVELYGI